ncbi:hypothetical protein CFC21_072397 [Triticum aestivum]|uniref:KIB1-4 beta-propeller domain-containing protein n=3 Tax=Triticum TaxID=4564 RepID=A0A9R0XCK0_TRITD|nr:uncharacterized protein LOC123112548 [Triticum aestivum]KAF7066406.1 hypothetical protein CFC21_072397 [Triticum aestivum]VAI34192.1 unnamed protein product [Triticum turgidum subsp. durum]
MAGWTSIPAELLAEISGRLPGDADRIHIHQVCSHWRASTSRLAACRPWIIAGREPWSLVGPVGEHSFWLPLGGRRIYLGTPTPAGLPYCCGTPLGWLALMDNLQSPTRFVLWEPLSEAEIFLPCLPAVVQVFLSGDPLTSPDWMAIASQKLYSTGTCMGQTLFFWRPGDAAWTMQLERPNGRIDSSAFHQGKFYFTDIGWTLHVYDLDRSPPKLVRSTYLYSALRERHGFRQFPGGGRPAWYVVAFNGELLLVVMYRAPNIKAVEVYRPDWAAERLELRDKVTDLGEYSLFLGRGDAFALCAKDFTMIRRNCLYFVEHDTVKHQDWAIVLDLGSNVFQQIPYPGEQMEGTGRNNHWTAYSWFCLRRPFLKGEAQ